MSPLSQFLKQALAMTVAVIVLTGLASEAAHAQSQAAKDWVEVGYEALKRGDKVAMNEAFAKACETDPISSGCIAAGQNFEVGFGVPQDLPRAAHLFGRSCSAGIEEGCTELATLRLETGLGAGDPSHAVETLRKACNADRPDDVACIGLAKAYAQGQGVAQDRKEALRLFEFTCRWGGRYAIPNARACFEAGKMHLEGSGGPKDIVKARPRLKHACETRIQAACDLVSKLGPDVAVAPVSTAPAVASSAPVAAPVPVTAAPRTLAGQCDAGDAYACESHAWDLGSAGGWLGAAQYASKGCALGRATSCSAAAIYQKNYRNHGDQSTAGAQSRREGIINSARQSGSYSNAIRGELRTDRDLATVAGLITAGGPAALQNLSFDEMADLAGQNWAPDFGGAGAYVATEWQRRNGPANLAAMRRRQADEGQQRQQAATFQGVGENETGTASCYTNGGQGKRYQYSGADGKMVYGPCVRF